MDNNNSSDPNLASSGAAVTPQTVPPQPSAANPLPLNTPTVQPTPSNQEDQIISDIPIVHPSQVSVTPTIQEPQSTAPGIYNMSAEQSSSQTDNPLPTTPSNNMVQQPGTINPQTSFDQIQNPFASSTVPTIPEQTNNPMTSNPFLQSHPDSSFNIAASQNSVSPLPDPNVVAEAPPAETVTPATPNPLSSPGQDPLNTAFSPVNSTGANPFTTQPQDIIKDQISSSPDAPMSIGQSQPAPTNPWDLPPIPPGTQTPADAIDPSTVPHTDNPIAMPSSSVTSDNPMPDNTGTGQANQPAVQNQNEGQIPQSQQSEPLDLSALTSTTATDANLTSPGAVNPPGNGVLNGAQPMNPLPHVPKENAPTDLSHLLSGEEETSQNGVYTPPIAKDQNLAVNPVQPQTSAEGEAPPTGKHLNLTKVLLVAGIPIILIVAALSAYLILGVGQPASESTTSLPVEQTTQTQAPLTNPPQQIVAPSPVVIPEPSAVLPSSSALPAPATASASPGASLSPAMQAAQRQASSSPAASASPASSASSSLPLN